MNSLDGPADDRNRDTNARSPGISEAAARGFLNRRQRRSIAAKQGWKRRRREGYFPKGRAHNSGRRGRELALAYRVQQVNRADFERRWLEDRARKGIQPSARGLQTLWTEYLACMKAYRIKGQDFTTTNARRARALQLAGRPRCTRTVQRAHHTLADMGLLRRHHVKRLGSRVGYRDCVRVCLLNPFVTLPSAAGAGELCSPTAPASHDRVTRQKSEDSDSSVQTNPGLLSKRPPPDGGRVDRAALRPPNGNGSDREGGASAAGNGEPVQESVARRRAEVEARFERDGLLGDVQHRHRHRRRE